MPERGARIPDDSAREPERLRPAEKLARHQPEFRFGLLLALLILTFFFIGAAPDNNTWVPLITVVLMSTTLLAALFVSGAGRILYAISLVVITFGLVAGIVNLFTTDNTMLTVTAALSAMVVLVGPFTIVRGIIQRRVIDLRTVIGALCLYVMFGLFFATLFGAIQTATDQPFFSQLQHAHGSDYLYFSFITLTTVGYGDLTAARGFGRTLSAFEAIIGQFYLVTVVALLVSNLGPLFKSGPTKEGAAAPVAEESAPSG